MTSDMEYRNGYDAGYSQAERLPAQADDWYTGYEDGDGDRWALRPNIFEESVRPVSDDYYLVNEAPLGFKWAGHKEIPTIGDWYLSKMGNATKAVKVRLNEQQRHILEVTGCGCTSSHSNKRCGLHG